MVSALEKGRDDVMGERLKEKTADLVIDYYKPHTLEVTTFDALIQANKAHVAMLSEGGIIGRRDARIILMAILEIESIGQERFKVDPYLVDLCINMEAFIIQRTGEEVGGKVNTGRSRNDLEPTILRIAARAGINEVVRNVIELRESMLRRASEHLETIMPGYTHMQPAQPITLHTIWSQSQICLREMSRDLSRHTNVQTFVLSGRGRSQPQVSL